VVVAPLHIALLQILRVAKVLAHTAKFRSALVNGGGDMGSQREQLERPLDLLVGTPQRIMQHAGEGCWGLVVSGAILAV